MLGLKTAGRGISQITENYVPTIDMTEWLKLSELENYPTYTAAYGSFSGAFFSFSSPGALTVPPNEIWWVDSYAVYTSILAAGDTVDGLGCSMNDPSASGSVQWLVANSDHTWAGLGKRAAVTARHFWAMPGQEFRFYTAQLVSAATVTFNSTLRIARYRV